MSEFDTTQPVLAAHRLGRRYAEGGLKVNVLDGVDLQLDRGDTLAIRGPSGSGKSTLLHLLAGLDQPDAGEVRLLGQPLHRLGEAARGRLRNRALGFIYQFHHLLPELTALENAAMPLLIRRTPPATAMARAAELLAAVGLGERLRHKPGELSGGERQRVAMARAAAGDPACILADEPTGNLDAQTADEVLEVLLRLVRERGLALVVVTHDDRIAARMQRSLHLRQGRLWPEAG